MLIGEFLAPIAEQTAQSLRASARSGSEEIQGDGFWARDGDYLVNVGAVLPGLRLAHIQLFHLDDQSRLQSLTFANEAQFVDGRWVMSGVARRAFTEQGVDLSGEAEIPWSSVITPAMLTVLAADPEDLSLRDLQVYIRYLDSNQQDAGEQRLAFWQKALAPLANLSMLFIALPFIFGSQRSAGVGQRLVIGVVLGLSFYMFNRMLGNLVLLYGLPPLAGAALPTIGYFVIGAIALSRQR